MDLAAKKAVVRRVRDSIGVSEVFCTRILKTRAGSVLVGLTASVDENASMDESEIATLILGERVDQLALDRALASSLITAKERTFASSIVKDNYHLLIDERLQRISRKGDDSKETPPVVLVGADKPPTAEGADLEDEADWVEGLTT